MASPSPKPNTLVPIFKAFMPKFKAEWEPQDLGSTFCLMSPTLFKETLAVLKVCKFKYKKKLILSRNKELDLLGEPNGQFRNTSKIKKRWSVPNVFILCKEPDAAGYRDNIEEHPSVLLVPWKKGDREER